MDFKNIPKKYRPIPFWSWNEKLEIEETENQVQEMNDVGMGGFFMHARGGLETEYLGEEWFDNIEAATKKAEDLEMYPWAYDENGWPSGFGNGMVNGLGVEYQQKYLRMEDTFSHTENAICKSGDHYFYFDVNPFYVDVLDKKVIKTFIESTYDPYYEKFGNRIEGYFTDEPQISRCGFPWSFTFEEEYKKMYGENILEHLEELFLPIGDYKKTRVKYWKMVTDLFSDAFCKQIYDWCNERGTKLTGHLLLEEDLITQLTTNGACMPHYEYFHIPGMDWLGRNIVNSLTARQVSSVAEQLGKKQILSETFALCGHNVSLTELKGIYEWQMARGINLLCQHLEGYSIRGIRKRDYPPAMYLQQPWWSEYKKWNDAMSRVGMIMSEGKKKANVLLLHPQSTVWSLYDYGKSEGMEELNKAFLDGVKALEEKHINFHLGDETIMERHARVENGKIIIGEQEYDVVIDSFCDVLLPKTEALLSEYKNQGGKFTTVEEIESYDIIDEKTISHTVRYYDGYTVHYFVNTSPDAKVAKVNVDGQKMDIYTGDMEEFSGVHRFEPWGSLMIFEDGTKNIPYEEKKETPIYLDGEFEVSEDTLNTLTLDTCDYYFDGKLEEANGYVLNICERAIKLERKVQIHMDYKVTAKAVPSELYLVCETPEKFEISVNGNKVSDVCGYFRDKSFKKIDISKYFKLGENTISFDVDFVQPDEFYKNMQNAWIFESEKNKLVYDMEIEAIYLLGKFSVETNGVWEKRDKNAFNYEGEFVIDAPKKNITLKNIEQQGFPFFCGDMELTGVIDVNGENPYLSIDKKGMSAVCVEVEGIKKTMLTDDRLSLCGLEEGKHKIKLTLKNNLRNLLGPHHLAEGETYFVGPGDFYKEKCVWHPDGDNDTWNNGFSFVEMSV